jgi:signal transduction histidine kinase
MSLRWLRWLTVLAPITFIAIVDFVRHNFSPELLHVWPGSIIVAGAVLIATLFFSDFVLSIVERAHTRLARQNRELLALHEAGLAIAGQLQVEHVLQKVVDQARDLIGARYGAIAVVGSHQTMGMFITTGISAEERARLGPPPDGHGLLGIVLNEGQRVRIAEVALDPRFSGFPPGHPPMRSLLAVAIFSEDSVIGNLYLANKLNGFEFSAEDEETLVRFATQAGLAVENARLHDQLQALAITEERERIAREMHDSLAQVLGYVNTKAQATQELLSGGQTERASTHLGQLAEAARDAYVDVRENVLALRTSLGPGRSLIDALNEYVERWEQQSGVTAELDASVDGVTPLLTQAAELQLLRIVQEALANVRKHAGAAHAWVRLRTDGQCLEAEVADDGTGFDVSDLGRAAFPRFGLATMRERAESVGGTLTIDSTPQHGSRVIARIPMIGTLSTPGSAEARAER